MSEIRIGKVAHYFDHISVAVLELTEKIRVGDTVRFLGHSTDFKQEVNSLQIEHLSVNEATQGQEVALKVSQKVHPNDAVIKITAEG
jgi:translation initiation factor IF-2